MIQWKSPAERRIQRYRAACIVREMQCNFVIFEELVLALLVKGDWTL